MVSYNVSLGAFGRVYRGVFVRSADSKDKEGLGDMVEVAIKTIKGKQEVQARVQDRSLSCYRAFSVNSFAM